MRNYTLIFAVAAGALTLGLTRAAQPVKVAEPRVGVYDSRLVAFAHFWSESGRKDREALIAAAKAAKDSGDTARFKELSVQLGASQTHSHLQVFSTAPADEAMAALKDRLSAIQQELGVARLVSKWDEAALRGIPAASQIDATDRLVREFSPDAKRLKTIEQMKTTKPLPLDEATRLAQAGKL
jgi:hypothetical protein